MLNEKNKVEAVLFASSKRMHIEEIASLANIKDIEKVKAALVELKMKYDEEGSAMTLVNDNDIWKLTVKDHYLPIMQKIVSQTELDRPLMQTLAVIAWKYPVVQSEVIKIRHNKAYDHMKRLEEMGFVTRQRFGRTNKITLTQKFFEYFDLPTKEQAKEIFKNIVPEKTKEKIEQTEKEIEEGERKIEDYNRKRAEIEEQRKAEKEKIEQSQKKEDKEIKKIEEDIKEIDQEEKKDVYSEVPEMQPQDEIPEPEDRPKGQE